MKEIMEKLQAPLPYTDIEWRIARSIPSKDRLFAEVLAYKTARADQARLDEAVGCLNWRDEYVINGDRIISRISIYNENAKEWITKEDGAECTKVESYKGGLSDAFKRAGFKWGIGRYLYQVPKTIIELSKTKPTGDYNFHKEKDGTYWYWINPDIREKLPNIYKS